MRPITFVRDDVLALKKRIRTNRFNRLRKRANKSASDKRDNPEVRDATLAAKLDDFAHRLGDARIDPAKLVFAAALHYLRQTNEVELPPPPFAFDAIVWRRQSVRGIMRDWLDRIGGEIPRLCDEAAQAFLSWRDCDDPLGLLYQGLSCEGTKSRTGAYFTPGDVIDASLEELGQAPASFLDPCCGTGRYLVHAAKRFNLAPESLYGFDADPVAVDIAGLNLLMAYPELDFAPRVRCLDSLRDLANGKDDCDTNFLLGSVDAIATNPPWGSLKNQTRYRNMAANIRSGESFSLFLEKSLRLLRPGGRLSFLLPDAMLRIKAHADIRRIVLDETRIAKIAMLGRVFAGVFTPIIRLDLIKEPAPGDWSVRVTDKDKEYRVQQKRFAANANLAFDAAVTPRDAAIMGKVFSVPHQTLAGNAEWALGIVTGDNGRCVLELPCEGSEPILRGRDVFKYAPRDPRCHIVFRPADFQQVAPERLLRAPAKLIYRFVSERLVFAYDDRGTLTLNSANILIPHLPGYSMKYVMAFLNSRVFQYIFTKRFQTRKVLRGDLETLPFPLLPPGEAQAIERQVELCMSGEYQPADDLDRMIYRVFGLDEDEIMAIEGSIAPPPGRVMV